VITLLKRLIDSDKGNRGILLLIYISAIAITMIFNTSTVYGPIHYTDEITYWQFAQDLVSGNANKIFTPELIIPPLYPLSIAPAFLLPKNLIYPAALLLSQLYLTSIIFPIYILLKKLTKNNRLSLAGATIILFHPFYFVFSRLILSENIYLPLFMWAVAFSFTGLIPPRKQSAYGKTRWVETVIIGLLIGLCYLTRYITLGVIPALLLIWWLQPFSGEKGVFLFSWKKLIYLSVMVLEITLLASLWIGIGARFGLPASQLLGFISTGPFIGAPQLTLQRLFLWTTYYGLYTLAIAAPVIGLLFAGIFKFDLKHWREEPYRWLVAVILIAGLFLAITIRHSWSAAYNFPDPLKLQGRYLIIFSPLFLITALTVLSKYPNLYQGKKMNIFILIISVSCLILSFKFLSDHKALFSFTSVDGAIIIFGNGLLFIILAAVLQLFLLIRWKKIPFLASIALPIGFGLAYLMAFPGIYDYMINKSREINYPVKITVDRILAGNRPVNYDSHLTVIYNPANTGTTYHRAGGAFLVRGFTNIEYIDKEAAEMYYSNDISQYLVIKFDKETGQIKTYILHRTPNNIKKTFWDPEFDFYIIEK